MSKRFKHFFTLATAMYNDGKSIGFIRDFLLDSNLTQEETNRIIITLL
jgi:hypothetical protein